MQAVSSLVKPVLESEAKNETLRNLLLSCVDQRAFSKDAAEIPSIIGVINAHCNASSSRYDGLLLLQAFLPQCTQDVLSKNASLWMQFCLKSMTVEKTAHVSFIVFKMLVQLSGKIPEMSKHITSVAIPSLGEQIQQGIPPQGSLSALECLEQCMAKYSGSCGPQRKVIERFLYPMLDYTGPQQLKITWQAARCVALLPQIGGGGKGAGIHKQAWSTQHKSLSRGVHLILDELYAGLSEIQVSFAGGTLEGATHLSLDPIEGDDPVLRIQKLTNRITALSACLQAMLVMQYPVPKEVSVSCLLGLICRGLAVNGSSLGDSLTTTRLALASNLPKIHYSLLKLLEALILLARSNLLPFGRLICKLVIQTLKWTHVSNWPYGTEKPYRCLRTQAYEILKVWCGIAKSGSYVADIAQTFVEMALSDVYTEKDTVSLSVAIKTKQGNQKSKRKGNPAGLSASGLHDLLLVNDAANKEVCVAALQALRALVMSASTKIQAVLHKVLQETLVSVLLQTINKTEDCPIPYSEPAPRLELYRLLLQLVLDSHSVWPAPTNIALKIFSHGLHDQDAQISMFCGIAQSSVEKIIHPAYSSLALLADVQELESCRGDEIEKPIPAYKRNASRKASGNEELDNEAEDEVSVIANPSITVSSTTLRNGVVESTKSSGTQFKTPAKSTTVSNLAKTDSAIPFNAVSTPVMPSGKAVIKTSPASSVKDDLSQSDAQTHAGESSQVAEVSGSNGRNMIDLTTSDKSDDDDDISEIPCEVDLAGESDDDNRSNISMCSRTTASPPAAGKQSQILVETAEVSKDDPKVTSALVEDEDIHLAATQGEKEIKGTTVENKSAESPSANASLESSKRPAEDDGGSSAKKQKADVITDDFSFNESDEENMLLSFVNVTREEEKGEEENGLDDEN